MRVTTRFVTDHRYSNLTRTTITVDEFAFLPSIAPPCEFPRLAGHNDAWIKATRDGLRHRCIQLTAYQGERALGGLAIMLVKGPIFGRFLVSLPYINTGGIWASDAQVAAALVDQACDLADKMSVRYMELRHEIPIEHPRLNFERRDKVHMRLRLPTSDAQLDQSFRAKLRSQIRKASKNSVKIDFGGLELIEDFYDVFAVNMRDLGTPVFARGLFRSILRTFQSDAEFCIARLHHRPIAAALLVHHQGITEIPSASSLRQFNHTSANMLMYRQCLSRAIERGSNTFDFGRSSKDSGTYKFKAQWGAEPSPAVWQYYVRQGSADAMRPESEGNQRLIRLWQKMPVWATRIVGPAIVRGIP